MQQETALQRVPLAIVDEHGHAIGAGRRLRAGPVLVHVRFQLDAVGVEKHTRCVPFQAQPHKVSDVLLAEELRAYRCVLDRIARLGEAPSVPKAVAVCHCVRMTLSTRSKAVPVLRCDRWVRWRMWRRRRWRRDRRRDRRWARRVVIADARLGIRSTRRVKQRRNVHVLRAVGVTDADAIV